MKVKVAAIQMSADIGGREANVERAERLLIQAARQGADLGAPGGESGTDCCGAGAG